MVGVGGLGKGGKELGVGGGEGEGGDSGDLVNDRDVGVCRGVDVGEGTLGDGGGWGWSGDGGWGEGCCIYVLAVDVEGEEGGCIGRG